MLTFADNMQRLKDMISNFTGSSMKLIVLIFCVTNICVVILFMSFTNMSDFGKNLFCMKKSTIVRGDPSRFHGLTPQEEIRKQTYFSRIPKILHQSWKNATVPEKFQKWAKSWRDCFPDYEYKLWTDEDNDHFVKNKFPQYEEMFSNFKKPIYKIDTVRYLYLFEYGGIYTDLDNECIRNFDHLLVNDSIIFGGMEDPRIKTPFPALSSYVQNSLMISAPRNPFWIELVEEIRRRPQKDAGSTTGPSVLMDLITRYKKISTKNKAIRIPKMRIYEPIYFNPWSWVNKPYPKGCVDLNRMTKQNEIDCRANFANASYVIQYHTQTWNLGKV